MSVIRNQGAWSTIITYIGFVIGAVNMFFILPNIFSKEQVGLVTIFYSVAAPLIALGMFGMLTIIPKFFPYYKEQVPAKQSDLLTWALLIPTIGILIWGSIAYCFDDFILRKLGKSPLIKEYYYLFPIYTIGLMYSTILENFNNQLKNTIWTSIVKELALRLFTVILIVLAFWGFIDFTTFIEWQSSIFIVAIVLFAIGLKRMNYWHFTFTPSILTKRVYDKALKYGGFFWLASFAGIMSMFVDTFGVAGREGLGATADFGLANQLVMVLQAPQRALQNIIMPIISTSWKMNDIVNIEKLYKKSALNLFLIGGTFFILIIANLQDILLLLPPSYKGIELLFIVLGVSKLIDLSTGVNAMIVGLSKKHWKGDFYGNILLLSLMLPLVWFFIKWYGVMGAAYANLLASFLFNTYKCIFLYVKVGIHHLSRSLSMAIVLISVFSLFFIFVPTSFTFVENKLWNVLLCVGIRSIVLISILIGSYYYLKISEDINILLNIVLRRLKITKS